MGGPNEREIGLCMWKQIGTFCYSNWSRHCINIPQAKYLFSVQSQIEPSIIIVYPWVRTSPKRRFLFLGWTRCSFHFMLRILIVKLLLGSAGCCEVLCLSGHPYASVHLHKKCGSLQTSKSTFPFLIPLLCFENKLAAISRLLQSPALAEKDGQKMREMCLCWAQPGVMGGSAAVVSPPRGRESRMDVKYTDDHLSNMTKWDSEQFPSH